MGNLLTVVASPRGITLSLRFDGSVLWRRGSQNHPDDRQTPIYLHRVPFVDHLDRRSPNKPIEQHPEMTEAHGDLEMKLIAELQAGGITSSSARRMYNFARRHSEGVDRHIVRVGVTFTSLTRGLPEKRGDGDCWRRACVHSGLARRVQRGDRLLKQILGSSG